MRKDPTPKAVHVVVVRVAKDEANVHRRRERLAEQNLEAHEAARRGGRRPSPRAQLPDYPVRSFLGRWSPWAYFDIARGDVAIVRIVTQKDAAACVGDCVRLGLDYVATQFRDDERVQKQAARRVRALASGLKGMTF